MLDTPNDSRRTRQSPAAHPRLAQVSVTFRDIGPLLDDPKALMAAVAAMVARGAGPPLMWWPVRISWLHLRYRDRASPWGWVRRSANPASSPPVSQVSYTLEYGEDQLEAADAFTQRRVLLVDDVLATGAPFVPPLHWWSNRKGWWWG